MEASCKGGENNISEENTPGPLNKNKYELYLYQFSLSIQIPKKLETNRF